MKHHQKLSSGSKDIPQQLGGLLADNISQGLLSAEERLPPFFLRQPTTHTRSVRGDEEQPPAPTDNSTDWPDLGFPVKSVYAFSDMES